MKADNDLNYCSKNYLMSMAKSTVQFLHCIHDNLTIQFKIIFFEAHWVESSRRLHCFHVDLHVSFDSSVFQI